jgi:hypothetical protein
MRKHCLSIALVFVLPAALVAQETKFIRLKEKGGKVTAMEIAITRYTNKSKTLTVDLVGVVHVGDRAYYQQLSKRFPTYDVVLYELVAPPGTRVPAGGKKTAGTAFIASIMTGLLDLDSQLACIDYSQKNFVHADLSFETMMAAARKRGESGLTLGLSVLADMMRQQNRADKKQDTADADVGFADALFNPNLLKRQMAKQMVDTNDLGPTLQALLIGDRNKKACEVLTEQIEDGKEKIAIFYGAAHMPDFDKRLRTEFGLRRQSQEWLTAWNLRDGLSEPGLRLKSLFEKALQDQ